jgi:ribosomal-protein-alanine N-acetyltransferase
VDYKGITFPQLKHSFPETEQKRTDWFRQLDQGLSVGLPNNYQLFIRWMQFNDIIFVCNLERQIFPSPWVFESFAHEIDNRDYNLSFVGLIGEQLVSYAVSYLVHDEIHIANIAVSPEFRRLKIGETMLWLTLQICKHKNCQAAHLEVRKSNRAAISMYQDIGFEVVGVRKNYYQNDNEDALLMSRNFDTEKIYGVV